MAWQRIRHQAMTFMPILGRELRLRARSRANYWGRAGVGLVAALVALPPLFWSGPGLTPAALGRWVSDGLAWTAFLLCSLACLLTADSISGERREGTLGLLFLTGVNRFDVLLGKFASTGLACLWALVGLLPMFMIPVLAGGLTAGEVVREGMVLIALLFLALSAGLCASARGFARSATARTALLTVAALVLLPLALSLVRPLKGLALASPLDTMTLAAAPAYGLAPGQFWLSLVLALAFGTLLLLGAARWVRSHLEGSPSIASASRLTPKTPVTPAPVSPAPTDPPAEAEVPLPFEAEAQTDGPPHLYGPGCSVGDSPPLEWRLARQRGLQTILWCATLASLMGYPLTATMAAGKGLGGAGPNLGIFWPVNLTSAGISAALLAWAASRFFVEARRTNELELLLTTPAGADTLVESQWRVLKRRLLWPVMVMIYPQLLLGVHYALLPSPLAFPAGGWTPLGRLYSAATALLGVTDSVCSVGALCWLGFWFGLRTGSQGRAILWTIGLARGVPYVFDTLYWPIGLLLSGPATWSRAPDPWLLQSLVPGIARLGFYLALIHMVRRQLPLALSQDQPLSARDPLSHLAPPPAEAATEPPPDGTPPAPGQPGPQPDPPPPQFLHDFD